MRQGWRRRPRRRPATRTPTRPIATRYAAWRRRVQLRSPKASAAHEDDALVQGRDLHEPLQAGRVPGEREERGREQEQRDQREVHVVEVDEGAHERRGGHAGAGEREADEHRRREAEDRPRRRHQPEQHHRDEERGGVDGAAEQRPGQLAERDVGRPQRRGEHGVEATGVLELEEEVERRVEHRAVHRRRRQQSGSHELVVVDGLATDLHAFPRARRRRRRSTAGRAAARRSP